MHTGARRLAVKILETRQEEYRFASSVAFANLIKKIRFTCKCRKIKASRINQTFKTALVKILLQRKSHGVSCSVTVKMSVQARAS
jgi:hypothetical protein